MAVFPGSYVETDAHSDARINGIVDNLLTPRMLAFRQISIFDENATLMSDGVTWRLHYGNWNDTFPLVVHKNSEVIAGYTVTSYVYGMIQTGAVVSGDVVNVTYNIDYFPVEVLAGFIMTAVDIVNTSAVGPPTSFTIDTAPSYWDGVLADLAFALAMERLILDYDLWYGRLIFALGPDQLYEGGGDVVSQLETLKTNAEERANKTLENEKFKVGNHQSPPTENYWAAIRGIGRSGRHVGVVGYGRLRGWRPTKYV